MGEMSPWHWAIVILIAVMLFGAKRLPDAARSLGRSARILKAELRGDQADAPEPPASPAPVIPASVAPAPVAAAAPPTDAGQAPSAATPADTPAPEPAPQG